MSNDRPAKKPKHPEIPRLEMKPREAAATLGVVRRISGRNASPAESVSPPQSESPTQPESLPPPAPVALQPESLPPSVSPAESARPETVALDLWASVKEWKEGNLHLPNVLVLVLYQHLDPAEQAIYTQLYQMSWGFGNPTCFVGLPKLARRAGMKPTATHAAVKRLESKGLVVKERSEFGKNREQGIVYRLPLPERLAESIRLSRSRSPAESANIKRSDQKEIEKRGLPSADPNCTICFGSGFELAEDKRVKGKCPRCRG